MIMVYPLKHIKVSQFGM